MKTLLITALFLWVSVSSQAQGTKQFTLKQAQDYAIQNNYNVKNADLDLQNARKKVKETTAIGLPQVGGSLGYQNFVKQPVQLIPAEFAGGTPGEFEEIIFGTEQNASLDITANQLIFDGSYIVALQASKTFVLMSENQMKKTEIDIMESVAQAYYTVVVAEENAKLLKQSLTNLETTLKETEALYKNGFAEETAVDQLKLTKANIENNIENAERQVLIAKNLLKYQMGIKLAEEIELTENSEALLTFKSNEAFLTKEFNASGHIDYKIASTNVELLNLSLKNEKAKYLPTLGGYFTYQQNSFSNQFDFLGEAEWYPTQVWGLSLNVPIFTSFMRRSIVQQAQIDLEKGMNQQVQVEEGLKLQVQTARSDYAFSLKNFDNEKANLDLATKIYKNTEIKYKEGVASSFDLNQSNNQLLTTQGNYISAMLQLMNSKAALDKALNNY